MNDVLTAPPSTASVEPPLRYRCCAARHTYGISALPVGLNEDVPDVATADPAGFGIGIFAEIYRTVRYRWPLQDDIFVDHNQEAADLAAFYATLAKQDCPASVLVRIEDAVLAHCVLYVEASHDPAIVYETHRPNDRAAVQLTDRSAILAADRTRFADPDWANFFVGSAGSSNYGHWLVDDLPRLKAVSVIMRTTGRPVRVLIHRYGTAVDDIRCESIRLLLGADVQIDLVDLAIPYHFDELFYVTPVTHHPVQKSPEAMEAMVRDIVGRTATDTTADDGPALIFVDRSPQYGRALSNHDDIRRIATDHGFTVLDPDGMRFVDQVRLFAGAQVVIGQMGAAMTNTLFCRPTTTVIHLAPTGWSEPFYFDLAAVRGHRYRVLFGAVADPAVPAHRSDFTIDPDLLKQAIRAL